MPPSGGEVVSAIAIGAAVSAWAMPLMATLAVRTGTLDHPGGYKLHARPTPYLGGVAVLAGVLAGAFAIEGASRPLPAVALGAAAVCLVGTIDDRRPVPPLIRVAFQGAVGIFIWDAGAGWDTTLPDWADAAATAGFVALAANALNLIDNTDGISAASAAAAATGVGAIALAADGAAWSAIVSAALLGACAGFLPFNVARPPRIFLGDGGSTLLGFLLATTAMGALRDSPSAAVFAIALLLVGIPLLDAVVTVLCRVRRGAPPFQGGHDHLTHRLVERLGSPLAVAGIGAIAQLVLSGIAVAAVLGGPE